MCRWQMGHREKLIRKLRCAVSGMENLNRRILRLRNRFREAEQFLNRNEQQKPE